MNEEITHTKLRELLRERKMRQKELMDVLGLSQQLISNIVNNKRKINPSEQKVLQWYFFMKRPFWDVHPLKCIYPPDVTK